MTWASGTVADRREPAAAELIRRTRELGFPIDTVRALLALQDRPQACCDTVDNMIAEQIAAVDAKIASLQRLREELSQLAAGCRGGGVISDCRILDALQPAAKA